MKLKTIAKTTIWGTQNSWSFSSSSPTQKATECKVELTIDGNMKNGFHIIIHPNGFQPTDYFCETLEDAYETGEELFDITREQWKEE